MGSKSQTIWKICEFAKSLKYGPLILQSVTRFVIEDTQSFRVRKIDFELTTGYPVLNYRNKTFESKEPTTLNWIEEFREGSVLWDIGANVGLYSLYAAKCRKCHVFAFEPSVFCIEHLARNIWLNKLQDSITIVPNPLSGDTKPDLLTLRSRDWGGATNSFGSIRKEDGDVIASTFSYRISGFTIDDAISKLNLPAPQHIKIDVDGIEPLILAGGVQTLKQVESVSVEVPTYRGANERVSELLSQAGLKLVLDSGNQIWRRV